MYASLNSHASMSHPEQFGPMAHRPKFVTAHSQGYLADTQGESSTSPELQDQPFGLLNMTAMAAAYNDHQTHGPVKYQYDTTIMRGLPSRRDSVASEPSFASSPMSSTASTNGSFSGPPTPTPIHYITADHLLVQSQGQQYGFRPSQPMSSSVDFCLPPNPSQQPPEWYLGGNKAMSTSPYSTSGKLLQMHRNIAELQFIQQNVHMPFTMSAPSHGLSAISFIDETSGAGTNSVAMHPVQSFVPTAYPSPIPMSANPNYPTYLSPLEAEFDLLIDRCAPVQDYGMHTSQALISAFSTPENITSLAPPVQAHTAQSTWDVIKECRTLTTHDTISPSLVYNDKSRKETLSFQEASVLLTEDENGQNSNEIKKELIFNEVKLEANDEESKLGSRASDLHEKIPIVNSKQRRSPARRKPVLEIIGSSCSSRTGAQADHANIKKRKTSKIESTIENCNYVIEVEVPGLSRKDFLHCEIEGCGWAFQRREHLERHKQSVHAVKPGLKCVLRSFGKGFWCKIRECKHRNKCEEANQEAVDSEVKPEVTRGLSSRGRKPRKKNGSGISRHDNKIQHYVTHLKAGGRNTTCLPRFLEMAECWLVGEEQAKRTMKLVYDDCKRKIEASSKFRLGKPNIKIQMNHTFWPEFEQAPKFHLDWEALYKLQDDLDGKFKCKL